MKKKGNKSVYDGLWDERGFSVYPYDYMSICKVEDRYSLVNLGLYQWVLKIS